MYASVKTLGREGKGRKGKGREGKGREGKGEGRGKVYKKCIANCFFNVSGV